MALPKLPMGLEAGGLDDAALVAPPVAAELSCASLLALFVLVLVVVVVVLVLVLVPLV